MLAINYKAAQLEKPEKLWTRRKIFIISIFALWGEGVRLECVVHVVAKARICEQIKQNNTRHHHKSLLVPLLFVCLLKENPFATFWIMFTLLLFLAIIKILSLHALSSIFWCYLLQWTCYGGKLKNICKFKNLLV